MCHQVHDTRDGKNFLGESFSDLTSIKQEHIAIEIIFHHKPIHSLCQHTKTQLFFTPKLNLYHEKRF